MNRLRPESTVLVVIDVQSRLAAAMPPETVDRLVHNAEILLEAANLLGVRVLASEQYPKGLGPTLAPLRERLEKMEIAPYAKLEFDAFGDVRFARALSALDVRAAVVLGMETHVCVFQTARELVRRGYETYVTADAVASRREEDRAVGLSLCERAGAIVTTTETVCFDWLRTAGTDAFREISKLVR
jgi:nicotinamidase-related amidase